MTPCFLHPETPAVGACEDCGQPFCGACLQATLGRMYCPSCRRRVEQLAAGRSTPGAGLSAAASSQRLVPDPHAPAVPQRPLLPAWASALIYLLIFLGVQWGLQLGLPWLQAELFQAARFLRNGPGLRPGAATGLGEDLPTLARSNLPVWCGLFLFSGWATLLVVLIVTGLMFLGIERRRPVDLGFQLTRGILKDAFMGVILASALFASIVMAGTALGWYHVHSAGNPLRTLTIILVATAILLPYAAVEEVGMRGYVLQAASRSGGRLVGVVVSSVAFMAFHCFNPGFAQHPVAIAGLVLAGLYLASAYLITGNLWLPIFLHTGWNLMEGPVFGLDVSGIELPASVVHTDVRGPEFWTGGSFGPEGGLLLCLLMLVHLALLWAVRPLLKPKEARSATDTVGSPAT